MGADQKNETETAKDSRSTIFITHAAPEDNEFAVWLSSRLALSGYRVWIEKQRLRGGDDFWDNVDRVLRTETIKQIVVFTRHIDKGGVKKEMGIGSIMGTKLRDPNFMIPIRADDVSFLDAPPEFIRGNILNAFPNWHDGLRDLLETLEKQGVQKASGPQTEAIRSLVDAREEGRRFVDAEPEAGLTNWFPLAPAPPRIRYYRFDGLQDRVKDWIAACPFPHVTVNRLVGSFADPAEFIAGGPFETPIQTGYDVAFEDFAHGGQLGPYLEKGPASNDLISLLRQHFDFVASSRGLSPVNFASGEVGWFFPDGVVPQGRVSFIDDEGGVHRRAMSGKFRKHRWHACLLAKPKIWPVLGFRILVNVVLSDDGKTPIPNEKTHRKRRKITRSWWNDVWRDRMLAAMEFLSNGEEAISMEAGNERFGLAKRPVTVELPVSYQAGEAQPVEEDENGVIISNPELDERFDDLDDETAEE